MTTSASAVPVTAAAPPPKRRTWLWIAVVVPLILFAVAFAGLAIWLSSVAQPMPEALAALASDEAVAFTQVDGSNWLVFAPNGEEADTGLIFYPGGLVDYRAYAPMGHDVAEAGYFVVIPPMPLNLAVFDLDVAASIIAAYPAIENWAVGGHSLGGSMAARYAYDDPFAAEGLLLLASYPDRNMSARDLEVTSVYGTNDGLALPEQVEASAAELPPDTVFVRVDGGNHAQMGYYGDQARDNPATISREAQQAQIEAAALALLERIDEDA